MYSITDPRSAVAIRNATNKMIRNRNKVKLMDEIINKLQRKTPKKVQVDIDKVSIEDQERIGVDWYDDMIHRCMQLDIIPLNKTKTKGGERSNKLCMADGCPKQRIPKKRIYVKNQNGLPYAIWCQKCSYDFLHKYSDVEMPIQF